MKSKAIENRIRTAAAFAEAGADIEEINDKVHAKSLYEGARWILNNARLLSFAPDLKSTLEACAEALRGLRIEYSVLTDDQYGEFSGAKALKQAESLLTKIGK